MCLLKLTIQNGYAVPFRKNGKYNFQCSQPQHFHETWSLCNRPTLTEHCYKQAEWYQTLHWSHAVARLCSQVTGHWQKRLWWNYGYFGVITKLNSFMGHFYTFWGYFFRSRHIIGLCFGGCYVLKISKGANIRNRYNQVPHMTQDTNGESDKLTDTTIESQEVSPFPAGDHKAHIKRRAQRHSNHKTEQKHKRSTKEVPPWNGQ